MNHRVYTFVSDLHMGDYSGSDDFHTSGSAPLLDHLIREVTADPEHHLVLLGDVFELWQFTMDEIFAHNAPQLDNIFALAGEGRLTYVIGNHDFQPFNEYVPKKGRGYVFGTVPMLETFEIPEIGLYAEHGHEHDPIELLMVPKPGFEVANKISRRFLYYLKYIENRIPDVEDRLRAIWKLAKKGESNSAQAILESLPENNAEAMAYYKEIERSLLGGYIPPSKNPNDSEDAWMRAAYKKMEESQGKFRTVLMGHTHVPRWVRSRDMTYINTGSWCNRDFPCSFVRVDVEQGSVVLLRIDGRNGDIRTREYHELLKEIQHT